MEEEYIRKINIQAGWDKVTQLYNSKVSFFSSRIDIFFHKLFCP